MATKDKSKEKEKAPKKKKDSDALALTLPGGDAVDAGLLDRAVTELNQVYQTKGLETARTVAECVIEVFFDGKAENFLARGGSHVSFAALKKRADLQVSYQFVWNSCAVYEQLRLLPAEVANALPMSHHKLLLPIKSEAKKRELAASAVEHGMSKRNFEEKVKEARKENGGDSKAGRPPLPAFVKAFGKLGQIIKSAGTEEIGESSFLHFSKEDARSLLEDLEDDLDTLDEIMTKVREFAAE